MQFHYNGFRAGDPGLLDAAPVAARADNTTDVLIVGCGPAGLTLAAQLSAFSDIHTTICEQKDGPLLVGQADGVACRTMEMFEAFGFAERVLKESYGVNEVTFWKPDAAHRGQIARSGRVADVEEGLSHMPHVILNQARVHDFYLDIMARSPTRLVPRYSRKLVSLQRGAESDAFPLTAVFELADGSTETIRAKYAVGCDGARSAVRTQIGRKLEGDSAAQAWGVMDVLVNTNFPDIRYKSLVQSDSEGTILIIPREGGYMVRAYVELDKLNPNERVSARNITREQLIAAAQRIFKPYSFDVKEVAWWSVYEIGQRLCDKFDDVPAQKVADMLPRIFIAGDACHTHSPKAGQGMNVSMQDAFNLGWKLTHVLRGLSPHSLLHTYSAERQAIAKVLIDFDREWAKMLSTPVRQPGDPDGYGIEASQVQKYFVRHGRYTAGTATQYPSALLTAEPTHQHLATGLKVGTRFHSAPVVRIADGLPMQLGRAITADARWRLMVFAPQADDGGANSAVRSLCTWLLGAADSPIKRYTPVGADVDSVLDVRAVFQRSHHSLNITDLPALLFPAKGKLGLHDYEKAFSVAVSPKDNIYTLRGIDEKQGCMVIVRPDQYIAQVLPLDATKELSAYFSRFMQASA
jgi:2-polyprenyl-6-methoxyphenol hydroxylase-like FAD-dependent oxidoreductase